MSSMGLKVMVSVAGYSMSLNQGTKIKIEVMERVSTTIVSRMLELFDRGEEAMTNEGLVMDKCSSRERIPF